jgi:cysteine-rich repeat protein
VLALLASVLALAPHAAVAVDDLVFLSGYEDDACGNGVVEALEACDDGGTASGDGCDSYCRVDAGFVCGGAPSICTSCANVPKPEDAGFTRTIVPSVWKQLTGGDAFPAMNPSAANVPHYGSVVYFGASRNHYTSVQIVAPSVFPDGFTGLLFDPSQITGTYGSAGPVPISVCPGDFRVSFPNPTDSTESSGCKSMSSDGLLRGSIPLDLSGVSTSNSCGLVPGHAYYVNYTNVNPIDGISTGEWTCYPSTTNNCGLQFLAR